MKSIKLLSTLFVLLFFVTVSLYSQDEMAPPKPAENKVYDAMCGEWTAEGIMMGMKMKQEAKIYWALDHQYIFMEVKSVSIENPAATYNGLGIFGLDTKGNAKTWWFDNWGAAATATGEGTFEGDKLIMKDGNDMFSETRIFEVKGNEMTMSAKGTMKMGGQDMPYDESTVFKKK
jgi:hypothetical protein